MKDKRERVKNHFKRKKGYYIAGIVIAGITIIIMRDRHAVVGNAASDGPDVATMRSLSFNFFSHQNKSGNVTTVISRDGRGHPGYITRWIEEMIDYETQGLAAQEHKVHPTVMSKHIRGIFPDINGQHFERVAA